MPGEYGAHQGRNAHVVEASGVQRGFGGGRRPIGGKSMRARLSGTLRADKGKPRCAACKPAGQGGTGVVFSLASIRVPGAVAREKFSPLGGVHGPTLGVEYPALFRRIYARFLRSFRAETG